MRGIAEGFEGEKIEAIIKLKGGSNMKVKIFTTEEMSLN